MLFSFLKCFRSSDTYHLGVRKKNRMDGITFNDLTIEPGFYPFYCKYFISLID